MKRASLSKKVCKNCGDEFSRNHNRSGRLESVKDYTKRKYCSHKCYTSFNVGDKHCNYKDGFRRGHNEGYLRLTNGQYVHRVIMEKYLYRKLNTEEHIHHINDNVLDNNISNLEILSNSEHRKLHTKNCKRDRKGRFIKK